MICLSVKLLILKVIDVGIFFSIIIFSNQFKRNQTSYLYYLKCLGHKLWFKVHCFDSVKHILDLKNKWWNHIQSPKYYKYVKWFIIIWKKNNILWLPCLLIVFLLGEIMTVQSVNIMVWRACFYFFLVLSICHMHFQGIFQIVPLKNFITK